jgi:hypothetical protein
MQKASEAVLQVRNMRKSAGRWSRTSLRIIRSGERPLLLVRHALRGAGGIRRAPAPRRSCGGFIGVDGEG